MEAVLVELLVECIEHLISVGKKTTFTVRKISLYIEDPDPPVQKEGEEQTISILFDCTETFAPSCFLKIIWKAVGGQLEKSWRKAGEKLEKSQRKVIRQ